MIPAIPKIYALGHRHTQGILEGEIRIQEKIDGSQFSFGMSYCGGCPHCGSSGTCIGVESRSKGAKIPLDPGMFREAMDVVRAMAENGQLPNGYIFQCEYLAKPKHNVLHYACIPAGHLVLFDVRNETGEYLPDEVDTWAKVLGIQPVPTLYSGDASGAAKILAEFRERDSVLGGCKMEGIVIKNYGKAHPESASGLAPLTAKVVSEKFKEKHAAVPFNPRPAPSDFIAGIVARYRTEARWLKAIQHLKEAGTLVNGPEDIGPLLKEIEHDTLVEEGNDIAQICLLANWRNIAKGLTAGFPEYYKKLLTDGPSIWQESKINETK